MTGFLFVDFNSDDVGKVRAHRWRVSGPHLARRPAGCRYLEFSPWLRGILLSAITQICCDVVVAETPLAPFTKMTIAASRSVKDSLCEAKMVPLVTKNW